MGRSSLRGLTFPPFEDSLDTTIGASQSSQSDLLGLAEPSLVNQDSGHTSTQVGVFDNSNILYEYWNANFLIGALVIIFGNSSSISLLISHES